MSHSVLISAAALTSITSCYSCLLSRFGQKIIDQEKSFHCSAMSIYKKILGMAKQLGGTGQ